LAAVVKLEAEPLQRELLGRPGDHEVDDLDHLGRLSSWKTMTSSMRFKNSGRKWAFRPRGPWPSSLVGDGLGRLGEAEGRLAQVAVPRFEVMISTVFLKSTERPGRR